jgi:hypothetical protein
MNSVRNIPIDFAPPLFIYSAENSCSQTSALQGHLPTGHIVSRLQLFTNATDSTEYYDNFN